MVNSDFAYCFNSILAKGKKDNTYKLAFARFLIDYSYSLGEEYVNTMITRGEAETIHYQVIAKSFLKYYWHQICKYKIKQNYNLGKLPLIVRIIQGIFGTQYIPESFDAIDKKRRKGQKTKSQRTVLPR